MAPVEVERPETDESVEVDPGWVTLVWNDPVNLMSYVSHGTRDEMERDTQAMHEYGLWATFSKDT